MDKKEFEKKVSEAKVRVCAMDKTSFKDRYLTTILMALKAGICVPDSDSHFDAFYMLLDLISIQEKIPMDKLNNAFVKARED